MVYLSLYVCIHTYTIHRYKTWITDYGSEIILNHVTGYSIMIRVVEILNPGNRDERVARALCVGG